VCCKKRKKKKTWEEDPGQGDGDLGELRGVRWGGCRRSSCNKYWAIGKKHFCSWLERKYPVLIHSWQWEPNTKSGNLQGKFYDSMGFFLCGVRGYERQNGVGACAFPTLLLWLPHLISASTSSRFFLFPFFWVCCLVAPSSLAAARFFFSGYL
jgi:hypothetical protein